MKRLIPLAKVFAVALALVLNGCATTKKLVCRPAAPAPSFHSNAGGAPMRRVALLPLCYEQEAGPFLRDMDATFNLELNKKNNFEVVTVSRADMEAMFNKRQLSSVGTLPADLLAKLSAQYGVDGVLLTDVTHYFPYHPISIGIRAKLVDARTGEVRCAFDHLYDSGRPEIANQARCYYEQNSQTGSPLPQDGSIVLQSPSRFSKFVACETYRSLLTQ